MSRVLLKNLPAVLVPVATLWVVASNGILPSPRVVVLTAAAVAALAALALVSGTRISRPAAWLAGLVIWSAIAALLRPVDPGDAAGLVAVAAVSFVLAVLAARPRVAAWGKVAVVIAGASAASWLVAERLAVGGRPGGPFENPNLAATVIVVALALVPALRWHWAARAATAAVLVAGAVASVSRAALLAVALICVVWVLSTAHRAGRVAVMALAVVAALGLVWRLATDRDPLRFERARIWLVAVRTAAAEMPFGAGPSGYADAAMPHNFAREDEFASYYRVPTLAESDPLELAAALGLPGIVLGCGLAFTILRAAAGNTRALAPCIAVALTSLLHTQLPVPAVAWTATLAVFASLPRQGGRRLKARRGLAAGVAFAIAPPVALALGAIPGVPTTAEVLARVAETALRARMPSATSLTDAEALAWRATRLRPRWAEGWSLLGSLRLARAVQSGDAALADAAAEAFATGRRVDPVDVWAALGEGRARRVLGQEAEAERALASAVRIEPNCAPAWIEVALLRVAAGKVDAARVAIGRAEEALARSRGRILVSNYERAMVSVDREALARLRARCGAPR